MVNPTPATPVPAASPLPVSRRLGKRLGVLALATLGAALLAEGLVLLLLGEQVKFPRHVVGAPFGLRVNQPNAGYRHKSPDVDVWFRINSQGMRANRDYPKEKPAGVKRILSLGDSFTIGYEVEVEQCFSSVLERTLRAMGHENLEVLNAGVSGYSTAEECLYLERELLQYDPDLVLVSFYTNDLQDNLRTELFRLDDGGLKQDRAEYVPLGRWGNFLNTNPVLSFLSSYSNAFAFLKEKFTREYKKERAEDLRHEKLAELTEEYARPSAPPPKPPEPAAVAPKEPPKEPPRTEEEPKHSPDVAKNMAHYSKRLAAAILRRMLEDCRARGIPLVIQVIPHLGQNSQGKDKLLTSFPYAAFDAAVDFSQPGLGFVDARALLEPHLEKEQLYWLRSHRHWTPFSHELSGKALAEYIEAQGFLRR